MLKRWQIVLAAHIAGLILLCALVFGIYAKCERGYRSEVDGLSGQIAEGQRLNRELKEANKVLGEQNQRAGVLVEELQRDNSELRDESRRARAITAKLQDENKRAGVLISELRLDNTTLRDESQRARDSIESIKATIGSIPIDLTESGDGIREVIEGLKALAILVKSLPD